MWVLKLGGSLLKTEDLTDSVKQLSDHGAGQLVIVPGGGIYADQVRHLYETLQLDEVTAHRLALRAMEQYGEMLISMDPRLHAAISIESIIHWLENHQIPVWFPYDMTFGNPAIKASWEFTSDSLSYWLAKQLRCENLVLVKATEPDGDNYSADYLSSSGFLDQAFKNMFKDTFVQPWWLYYRNLSAFFDVLGNKVPDSSKLKRITG